MKFVKIPKKNKTYRVICVPSRNQKRELRSILYSSLNKKQLELCDREIVQGFIPLSSPITNAIKHIGYAYSTKFDLKDFFDTVTIDHVKEYLSEEEISKCMIDNHFWQGLPTSPAIANLAAIKLDKDIKDFLGTLNDKIVYTRYADDLNISHDKFETYLELKKQIPIIIKNNNFVLNEKKIRLQDARYGRRNITGIYVDNEKYYTSRKFRHRLRAMRHKSSYPEVVHGLECWDSLKLPIPFSSEKQLDNLVKSAIVVNNKAMFKNVNDPKIQNVIKPVVERLQNIKFDPTRRNKYKIKNIVKDELAKGIIDKELLKKVSKLNKE